MAGDLNLSLRYPAHAKREQGKESREGFFRRARSAKVSHTTLRVAGSMSKNVRGAFRGENENGVRLGSVFCFFAEKGREFEKNKKMY